MVTEENIPVNRTVTEIQEENLSAKRSKLAKEDLNFNESEKEIQSNKEEGKLAEPANKFRTIL
jgi:hypothetical protein